MWRAGGGGNWVEGMGVEAQLSRPTFQERLKPVADIGCKPKSAARLNKDGMADVVEKALDVKLDRSAAATPLMSGADVMGQR